MSEFRDERIGQILKDLWDLLEGFEEILVINQDGHMVGQLPERESNLGQKILEFVRISQEGINDETMGGVTDGTLKGKKRFIAFYKIQDINVVLGLLGKATINFGLLDSASRSAIEKIRQILK